MRQDRTGGSTSLAASVLAIAACLIATSAAPAQAADVAALSAPFRPIMLVLGALVIIALAGFYAGRTQSLRSAGGEIRELHSLPSYYGLYVALWCGLPAFALFAIWLIVAGTTVVSLLFAFVTNALVSRRIEASLGRAKVRGTEGHVILIGLGSVGMRILDGLRKRGKEVVVIERDEDNRYSSQARLLGVRVILGDATLERTLEAANLSTASAVAVMTSDDMTNIEAGLAVREGLGNRWEKTPVILRVFDRELGFRLEQSFEFRHVWSTAAIAAPWFVGAAIGMEVLATFYVGREPFQVAKLKVKEGGGLVGMRMVDLGAKARVLAINRSDEDSGMEYPPRRGTKFGPGDNAYIAGPYDELMKILRMDKTPAVPGQS